MGVHTFYSCSSLTTICGATSLTAVDTWDCSKPRGVRLRFTSPHCVSSSTCGYEFPILTQERLGTDLLAACSPVVDTISSVADEESDACSAKCCKGTWSGTTCTTAADGLILVKHDTTSGHSHRCYEDASHATRGCRCQCANSAGDFTADNKVLS